MIGYFIGFIMIFSAFGVIFFGFGAGSGGTVKYNGLKFADKGNFWSVKVNGREALFTYLPEELSSLNAENASIGKLKNAAQIDATSEFNDTLAEPIALAQFQMGIALNNFGVYLRSGFTDTVSKLPVIKCGDSTNLVPVIYFRSANETKIYSDGSCIIAEAANGADAIRAKDRLVYGILGIMQ